MNKPLISILIPSYNNYEYITDCVESVLVQNFTDFELVILNDGSTDNTQFLLEKNFSNDSRVILIQCRNNGLLYSRRILLNASSGEYIIFVDSDDMLRIDALEKISRIIKVYSPDIIVYNASQKRDFSDSFVKKEYIYDKIYKDNDLYYIKKEFVATTNLNSMCFKAVKRRIIDMDSSYDGFRNIDCGEDLLQSIPIFDKGQSVFFINDNLYYYRPNSNSMINTYNKNRYYSTKKVLQELDYYLQFWKKDDEIVVLFNRRCLNSIYECIKNIIKSKESFKTKIKDIKDISNDDFFITNYKYIFTINKLYKIFVLFCVKNDLTFFLFIINAIAKIY